MVRLGWSGFAAVWLGLGLAAGVSAQADNPWAHVKVPVLGAADSIGDYNAGCLRGAVALPQAGPGYQVMRLSRLRYYGHPDLIAVIEGLGRKLESRQLGDVLVGDLSQPRGGPAPGGHSSHQTGLDVDLWYRRPESAQTPISREQRETFSAPSVLDAGLSGIEADQRLRVLLLLRLTAEDPHVARIFVHPLIKREACAVAGREDAAGQARAWLQKLRPWFGHDDHFHVRLACPTSAPACVAQAPLPVGDGCGDLAYWLSPAAEEDRKKSLAQYAAKIGKAAGMPPQCQQLIAADPTPTPKTQPTPTKPHSKPSALPTEARAARTGT